MEECGGLKNINYGFHNLLILWLQTNSIKIVRQIFVIQFECTIFYHAQNILHNFNLAKCNTENHQYGGTGEVYIIIVHGP